MSSVLTKYQRTPKIYIKLPSNGAYYKDIEFSMDDRLPVLAMTAKDELLLKSPDALLNGDAIIKIIQSCCPAIKTNPKDLLAPDVEAIILAILHSSYGDNLDFEAKCPKCEQNNSYSGSISSVLDTVKSLIPPYIIEDTLGENKDVIKFYIKPYTYETMTKKSLSDFENSKILQYISNPELDDDIKLKKFGESFNKMAEYNFEIVSSSIEKIVVPDGEVTDPTEIKSFMDQAEGKLVERIIKMTQDINVSSIDSNFAAVCQNKECNHEWTTKIEFDPSRFFVSGFKR